LFCLLQYGAFFLTTTADDFFIMFFQPPHEGDPSEDGYLNKNLFIISPASGWSPANYKIKVNENRNIETSDILSEEI
jgi:hypothetical protein